MRWQSKLGLCFCLMTGSLCGSTSWATEPKKSADHTKTPNAQIIALLKQEADGQAVDRRVLASLAPGDEFGAWQAGLVRKDDAWCQLEELEEATSPARWKEYVDLRAATTKDASGHRQLAIWCAKHGLDAQARAHWSALIDLEPNDVQGRTQLGHTQVGGLWFSDEQCQRADAARKELIAGLSKWSETCQKIAAGLSSTDLDAKKKALQKLRTIKDPSAIPALEIACLQNDESLFEPWIEAIAQFRAREACMAFVRIALTNPESPRGASAIQHIREYAPEFYVPELLSVLSTPVETKLRYAVNEHGELTVRRAMFRDTKNQKQILEFERIVRTNDPTINQIPLTLHYSRRMNTLRFIHESPLNIANATTIASVRARHISVDEVAAAATAMEDQRMLDKELAEFNRSNEKVAGKVFATLEKTTGANPGLSPEKWWQWWRDANYRTQSAKPVAYKGYRHIDRPVLSVPTLTIGKVTVSSCLVAGTQIQTLYGLKPIESIEVGDQVLSQNVETGQLGFKPIVRTTLREPTTIFRIETESGELRATAGHRWWVPGQGWLMSKQLQSDMLLHNATGTTKIMQIVEEAQPLPTHNLVVEGFHTYFVGKDRVLSFDNIEPEPTLRTVPGYGLLASDR